MPYYVAKNKETGENYLYEFEGKLPLAIRAFYAFALATWGSQGDEIKIISGGISRKNSSYTYFQITEESDWNILTDPNIITITNRV